MIYKRIHNCRLCKSSDLHVILNLGNQSLTGVFPDQSQPDVETGPLELLKCGECHLVQLAHNYELAKLYGDTYGYRSGLNASMVKHLTEKVALITKTVKLAPGDVVLDIGANDGTTLGAYSRRDLTFIGMDPSAGKFKKYYKPDIAIVTDFFSAKSFRNIIGDKKAKVVTSIAMFYDLEDPIDFAKQVASVLDTEGVWVFEQSYLPLMIKAMAYDTVCHEHLEYYCLFQINKIVEAAGLRVLDVEFNLINGGSFSVSAVHSASSRQSNSTNILQILETEKREGYQSLELFRKFEQDVKEHRSRLLETIASLIKNGARIHGYGASTKGNVILQYCGLSIKEIEVVAEVNEEKFGHVTPGTQIPITSEAKSKEKLPTHYLVLPWHFRDSIVEREKEFCQRGGKLLFPLPKIEIVP